MASANLSRREQSCLARIAHCVKLLDDFGKSQIEMSFDILGEQPVGLDFPCDAGDIGPKVSRIGVSLSLAAHAERLTGITGSDDMNAATPRTAIKGFEIVPNRCRSQGRFFHPRHESGRSMGFPLDVSHSAVVGLCDVQAKIKAGVTGTEGQAAKVRRLGAEGMGACSHNERLRRLLMWQSGAGSRASGL